MKQGRIKGAPPTSRTPILDTYKTATTFMPEEPEVEKYISREKKTIFINTAARPDAKIVRLI